jgi:hypothetical protein
MTTEATSPGSGPVDGAPLYEDGHRGRTSGILGWTALVAGAICVVADLTDGRPEVLLLVGLLELLVGFVSLWQHRRGAALVVRGDRTHLTIYRGKPPVPVRAIPYSAIDSVDCVKQGEDWRRAFRAPRESVYFAFGASPSGAVRLRLREGAVGDTPNPVVIGTNSPESLARFIRQRIEHHDE